MYLYVYVRQQHLVPMRPGVIRLSTARGRDGQGGPSCDSLSHTTGEMTLTPTSVLINEHDEATIVCPNCHRTKQTRLTQYKHLQRPLSVKCACGSLFTVTLGAAELAALQPDQEVPLATTQNGTEGTGQVHCLSFHGTGGTLFAIHMVNILLMLCTLGIYQFWGKTKLRRYIEGQSEFLGDRFAYHGTGKELWRGWLEAAIIFGSPLIFLDKLPRLFDVGPVLEGVAGMLTYLVILVFTPVAMVNARRYLLSRTSWRGIRFSFRGRVADFLPLFLHGIVLTGLTLGLYYPIFAIKRYVFMTSHSYFGNQPCCFDGRPQGLFRRFLLALLLSIPTLGLYWFWFLAEKQRYLWHHTTLATARFHSTVTGKELLILKLGNLLLLLLTLGLAWSWVKVRNIRFAYKHLALVGPLDLATFQQELRDASATGEGLMCFLDFLDAGFDVV